MEKQRLTNIIPKGDNWASMPIGAMARIGVHFELLSKWKRPPKYTAQLLTLICEKIQKASLYGEGEQMEIEVSVRQLAQELTPHTAVKTICEKTIYNGLQWLIENDWVRYDTGNSKSNRSVITINLEMVKKYCPQSDVKPTFSYDNQFQEWQNVLKRIKH